MDTKSINPATGETIATYPEMTIEEVSGVLQRAQKTFESWRRISFKDRARPMREAAAVLRRNSERYARLMTLEMGKPIRQARAEVEKCAWVCEYYSENAERFLSQELVPTNASKSFVTYQPIGIVLAIMPWNFPFWQLFRFAAPALMAGNASVLKHASNVTGCALAIEEVFREAGSPQHVFQTIVAPIGLIPHIIDHQLVKAVTLTGSTQAGKSVASQAGRSLKKTVLELGGSDPYIVLDDADLPQTAEVCAAARLINSGQSCIAAKRFIVTEGVRTKFEEVFVERMRARKTLDPLREDSDVGPLARHDLRDELHSQVRRSMDKGARLLLGGVIPEGKGAFYPPTVLTDVRPGMAAFDEETFGPVAAVVTARNEEEALALANDSPFGLGAAVFTRDIARGERLAAEYLEAGSCFVNSNVVSDPRLPFGGIKESGFGRELGIFGIREFVNIKTVYIK